MYALYLLHTSILYNVLSIKVSDNNVYMFHIHLYCSGPIWLDILYTQITADNSLCKILIPNITYKFNYLTCHVIQTKYTEYPTELDRVSIHVQMNHNVPYKTIDNHSMQPPILVSERLLRIVPTTQGFTQQDPSQNFSHS